MYNVGRSSSFRYAAAGSPLFSMMVTLIEKLGIGSGNEARHYCNTYNLCLNLAPACIMATAMHK